MSELIYMLPSINILIFQFIAGVGLFVLINILGYFSKEQGYESLSELTDEHWGKFNTAFRILTPPIYLAVVTIILYMINRPIYITEIWLVTFWYTIFQFLIYKITRRWEFKDKRIFFSIQSITILLSYVFYKCSFVKGLDAILPDGSFRNEIWLLVVAYVFTLFTSSYSPFSYNKYKMVENTVIRRYDEFYKKYKHELTDLFETDKTLRTILFSIMIVEDMNRPKLFRFIEHILFSSGLIKSTGIMQVTSDKYLSDKESVVQAQQIIVKLAKTHKKYTVDPYSLVWSISLDYNPDNRYAESVKGIFSQLYCYDRNQ